MASIGTQIIRGRFVHLEDSGETNPERWARLGRAAERFAGELFQHGKHDEWVDVRTIAATARERANLYRGQS